MKFHSKNIEPFQRGAIHLVDFGYGECKVRIIKEKAKTLFYCKFLTISENLRESEYHRNNFVVDSYHDVSKCYFKKISKNTKNIK